MHKFINEASFWMPESLVPSAWASHVPFAFWLVDVHQPKLLVELGTHHGLSFFAFDQAVKRLGIGCRSVAVDTWRGDEQAGQYGDEIFEQVRAYNDTHYGDFSELMQCTFDEAVGSFEDGTIDLLHIDGRHFYEDVKHDFETWKSKLSKRAVVLFHDTNVRSRGFGVHRLWEELKSEYPNFEFVEGHGLGVLGYGREITGVVRELLSLGEQGEVKRAVLDSYRRLGSAVVDRAALLRAGSVVPPAPPVAAVVDETGPLRAEIERLSGELGGQSIAGAEMEETHRQLTGMYDRLHTEHEQLDEMYHRLRSEHLALHESRGNLESDMQQRSQECNQLRIELAELDKVFDATYQSAGAPAAAEDTPLKEKLSGAYRHLEGKVKHIADELQISASQIERLSAEIGRRDGEIAKWQQSTKEAIEERDAEKREAAARLADFNRVLSSRSWRLTAPLRGIGERTPGARTSLRKVLKVLWWMVTLQIFSRLRAKRNRELMQASGLFDADYYSSENLDVAQAGMEPVTHYVGRGAREGRNPHPLFDTSWYLEQNPDVAAAGLNPLAHYLLNGWKEGRAPHPLFNLSYYVRGDNQGAKHTEAAKHYLDLGWKYGFDPHPLFDGRWYLKQNPDVLAAGVNPFAHYLQQGWKEKRSPHPLLDASWYANQLPSESRDGTDPLLHYVHGGWKTRLTPHRLFDAGFYLEENPDVAESGMEPLEHYLQHGWKEGRNPHPLFDAKWYLEQNPDVDAAASNPLIHYVQHGWKEGRNPHPLFDTAYYLQHHPELAGKDTGALEHFVSRGGLRVGDPHPLFDVEWYLEQNRDVAELGINPLVHFVRFGWKEGRNPNSWSDVPRFLRDYSQVAKSGLEPLVRFLSSRKEDRQLLESGAPSQMEERRRIVFVSGEPNTPGHTYRVANVSRSLPSRFFESAVLNVSEIPARLNEVQNADIVWIWRANWSADVGNLIDTARRSGAKIIFDVDDLMFRPELATVKLIDGIRTQHLTEVDVRGFYERIQMVLERADHCTVPTSVLAGEIREFHKPATVIPNGFDQEVLKTSKRAVRNRQLAPNDGVFRIGYAAGTRTHQRDLRVASRAIADILNEHEFARLVLFRGTIDLDEFPELQAAAEQIEWRDCVSLQDLPYEYARFDVNVAPLEVNNRYCEAKSELKYFEAALVNVATVASPTVPFKSAIRHGETGFLAYAEEDWRSILTNLILDKELGRRVAGEARREVLWIYGPERRHILVTRLLHQILATAPERARLFYPAVQAEALEKLPQAAVPSYEVLFESGYRGLSRVSVVMPLFNYENYLKEALDSILQQTNREIDIIVVDDVSTDSSARVANEWLRDNADHFNFVALLRNRENSKLGRTRNAAVSFCDTEFFLPLDPDNLLLPECIAKLSEALDETGAAFAYPTIELFGDYTGEMGRTEYDPALFQSGNYIDAMAMVRKACWLAVGGYAPLDPPGWEDYDFWCRFVENGFTGIRVKDVIARYRVHNSSMLRTTTEVPTNKMLVVRELNVRHPWLNLRIRKEEPRHDEVFAAPHLDTRTEIDNPLLKLLIPVLRCPETGEELVVEESGKLVTRSGSRAWPIVQGVPVFTPEGSSVIVQSATHTSNPLPEEAIRIIESCQGPVLNLSAGASVLRFENVVELEYTIFKHTSIVGDVHCLPFQDEVFEAVICLNAFEHYREPDVAMDEIRRVLKPDGRVFIRTAFLQPLHEAPHHYYDCTEFGLRQWLRKMNVEELCVSENFNPIYGLSWLLSEIENGFRKAGQLEDAKVFTASRVGEILSFWRDPATRNSPIWHMFYRMPHEIQKQFAAGWQAIATK